jgi:hypothetical protein
MAQIQGSHSGIIMTWNLQLAPAGIASYLAPILCTLLAQAAACHFPPDESTRYVAATGEETCIDLPVHEVRSGLRCSERAPAACAPGADPELVGYLTLSQMLDACFLHENRVQVELEQGCAIRFGLLRESPGSVECITSRLAAGRYDCLGDLACGVGEVSTLH